MKLRQKPFNKVGFDREYSASPPPLICDEWDEEKQSMKIEVLPTESAKATEPEPAKEKPNEEAKEEAEEKVDEKIEEKVEERTEEAKEEVKELSEKEKKTKEEEEKEKKEKKLG